MESIWKKWDLMMNANVSNNSEFLRFYGIGNGFQTIDPDQPVVYYNTQYKNYGATLGLSKEFWKRSRLMLGVHYENNSNLNQPPPELIREEIPGLKDANLMEAVIKFDLDFRDRTTFSNRGMRFYLEHRSGINTVDDNQGYFITRASIENHSTFKIISPWTFSAKLRGSASDGEDVIPFYKMVYLGQSTGLRGWQNNRFTGRYTTSFSSELRIQLTDFTSTFVPLKIGIKGFFDFGRVYSDLDVTQDLFTGYGFGLYIIPISQSLAINISYGMSQEESGLILLSIGTSFR
jgi:hypothetical protein